MNVTVENLAPCKKLLRVEVDAQEVEKTFDAVTRDFQRQVRLPGFRPGKAPREMVEKRFSNDIQDEVKKKIIPDSFKKAVTEQKLEVVGNPDIEEIQFSRGQNLQFAATVETAPEFEIPDYKGLPVRLEIRQVTDTDVERAMQMLRDRHAQFNTVTRELQDGDVAVVNYFGRCEGKPILEHAPTARGLTEQKSFWINIEPTSFIPGFAEQLKGLKAGDKKEVAVDFPADFVTPQIAGKKGAYDVEIVEVKEKAVPAMGDELAKAYGAENLEELQNGVRHDLTEELKRKQNAEIRNQVVHLMLTKINCELPENLVLRETRNVVYNIVNENQRRGVSKEAIDEKKDEIFASASINAKDRVKASFLFERIAEKEGIKVEQKDLANRIGQMASANQIPVEKLVKDLQKRNAFQEIYEQLMNEKVIDFLVLNAQVEEIPVAPQA